MSTIRIGDHQITTGGRTRHARERRVFPGSNAAKNPVRSSPFHRKRDGQDATDKTPAWLMKYAKRNDGPDGSRAVSVFQNLVGIAPKMDELAVDLVGVTCAPQEKMVGEVAERLKDMRTRIDAALSANPTNAQLSDLDWRLIHIECLFYCRFPKQEGMQMEVFESRLLAKLKTAVESAPRTLDSHDFVDIVSDLVHIQNYVKFAIKPHAWIVPNSKKKGFAIDAGRLNRIIGISEVVHAAYFKFYGRAQELRQTAQTLDSAWLELCCALKRFETLAPKEGEIRLNLLA